MSLKKLKILTCFPDYILTYGIGYAAAQIALNMKKDDIESDVLCIKALGDFYNSDEVKKRIIIPINNKVIFKLIAKFCPSLFKALFEKKFYALCEHYDVIYMWQSCPLEWYQFAKQKNKIIISEFINCHQNYSKHILDAESRRINMRNNLVHPITQSSIDDENQKIKLCDFIFSPSPSVTESLINNNVSPNKIIDTSYGLMAEEQHPIDKTESDNQHFTAIFVARGIVRKGLHLLLDYWDKADINGTLKIIGRISPEMSEIIQTYQQNNTIEFIDFADNLVKYYRSSDVFVLPSLEEGSPLVIYQALGAGLPAIVSPMGSGGVVRDKVDGFILDPHDEQGWISAIQRLATDKFLRNKMASSARENSDNFLWSKVAIKRLNSLLQRLQEYK